MDNQELARRLNPDTARLKITYSILRMDYPVNDFMNFDLECEPASIYFVKGGFETRLAAYEFIASLPFNYSDYEFLIIETIKT